MELFLSNEMLMAYVEKITMQKITIDHSKNESGAFIQVQKRFIAYFNWQWQFQFVLTAKVWAKLGKCDDSETASSSPDQRNHPRPSISFQPWIVLEIVLKTAK